VFLSKKEIERRRPVMELDFTSLYPSLMITFNLSSDKMILTYEKAVTA